MIYYVIVEKFTPEAKKNLSIVWEWQKQLDKYLISHGAKMVSIRHFLTLVGEPFYETWLEYPNYTALDEEAEKVKEFASDQEWKRLVAQMDVFFERVSSRIMKEVKP